MLLKAKNVTIRTSGGVDGGYLGDGTTGVVKTVIDEFDYSSGIGTELKDDGIIVASLLPNATVLGVTILKNTVDNLKLSIGIRNDTTNELIVPNQTQGQTLNLGYGVINSKLNKIMDNNNIKVNSKGLVDIVLNLTDNSDAAVTTSGSISVMINYF